ncbi:radical SAM protein [Methanocella sp. MCL-LM]|uniref:radical SAM protein n=1 Tax=Methanocella sp. MCL-LM TaxID=3412035 RepID=UPI003C77F541
MTGDSPFIVRHSSSDYHLFKSIAPLLGKLDIELTERCNNACMHCSINLPEHDEAAKVRELSTDEWKRILKEAADLGAMSIRFTGGEPLLREDFQELYLFARRLGLSVMLFTNARLITPELADLFARVPPRELIEITVYGMHPESYDMAACSPGAFEEFRRGVDLLMERKIPFVVKGALLPPNKGEMDELRGWAKSIPWMEGHPPSYSMFFNLRGRWDSAAKNRLIASVRISPAEGLEVLTRDSAAYRKEMGQFCRRFMSVPGDRLFPCGAGHGGCVDAYGMFQVCMGLRSSEYVYDLRKGSLKEALTTFVPKIIGMKSVNPAYLSRCARCFIHGLCEQCPTKSWAEHGTLDTPVDYLCEVAHAQARYLGLLAEGERAWEVADGKERVEKMSLY